MISVSRPAMTASTASRTAALLAALLLAGCGVRGNLEAPPEAKAAGATASPESAAAGENTAAAPKPHKPFILDGLIR
jgi:predicted small lipoprotein YifL